MVDFLLSRLVRWYRDEKGQGMVEYGLIIALIAVALIATLGPLRNAVANIFTTITDCITNYQTC